jgi:hypothetical protein
MQNIFYLFLIIIVIELPACNNSEELIKSLPSGVHTVKVIEHFNALNYTYIQVSENKTIHWIAVPQLRVENGDVLFYSHYMEMKNIKVENLNRTFESLFFVQDISRIPHTFMTQILPYSEINLFQKESILVDHPKGSKTIEDIYSNKEILAGKVVKVKGKVIKFKAHIMGRNWIYIKDGTGADDTSNLVIISGQEAKPGDIITVKGVVSVNKDFGIGYSYQVVIEKGQIIKRL